MHIYVVYFCKTFKNKLQNLTGVMSARWYNKWFLTLVPLTEKATKNYTQKEDFVKISESVGEPKVPAWSTETEEKKCSRKVREEISL